MFIYNVKVNSKNIVKIAFTIMCLIITIFFFISIYKILSQSFRIRDEMPETDIAYITPDNYTNILKCVYEDLDTYVGQTICFTGYVYRNIDFTETQFVLARDMISETSEKSNKTLIVGFLCNYNDASKFIDNTWVKITGKITKGNYHGEIPIIEISKIEEVEKPSDEYVFPPDDTYIPTAILF